MNVIVIEKHDVNSWNYIMPVFQAICSDEDVAKKWIQDEVDGKHPNSGTRYMRNKDADWWIKYGTFSLRSVEIQGKEN